MTSAWLPGSHPPHLPLPHPAHSIAMFCSPPPYLSLEPVLHHPPGPRCSTRSIFLPQRTFGNVRRHLWLSRCVGGCTGTWRVEARAAGKHPTVHRVAPHPAQSVNDAEVEKPFPGPSHHHLLPAQAQGPLNQPSCRHLGSAPTDPSLPRSQSYFNTSILLLYFRADPSSSPGPSRPGVIWPLLCSHPAFSLRLHLCAPVSRASLRAFAEAAPSVGSISLPLQPLCLVNSCSSS